MKDCLLFCVVFGNRYNQNHEFIKPLIYLYILRNGVSYYVAQLVRALKTQPVKAPYRTEVGTHFERVYVSKHCSGISKDRIGTVFTIQALRYKTDPNDPEIKYDFDSNTIRREFCR